jgi:hypothetical protein
MKEGLEYPVIYELKFEPRTSQICISGLTMMLVDAGKIGNIYAGYKPPL